MARRREDIDGDDESRRRLWDGPVGWTVSLAAMAAFVAIAVFAPVAAVVIAILLGAVELVALARHRGRPWLVEAETGTDSRRTLTWRVSGRRRSREVADEVVLALERGHTDTEIDPTGAERL